MKHCYYNGMVANTARQKIHFTARLQCQSQRSVSVLCWVSHEQKLIIISNFRDLSEKLTPEPRERQDFQLLHATRHVPFKQGLKMITHTLQ